MENRKELHLTLFGCEKLPPNSHGGIEWVVYLYARAFGERGYGVYLHYTDGVFQLTDDGSLVPVKPRTLSGCVVIVNDISHLAAIRRKAGFEDAVKIQLLHWRSPAFLDIVISPSRYCAIMPLLQRKRVIVVPHPVYSGEGDFRHLFDFEDQAEHERLYEGLPDRYLFVPARLCRFKNVKRAFRLSKELSIPIVWAGPCEDERLLGLFDGNDSVYIGNIPRKHIIKLMRGSVAALCLTKYIPAAEAFGLFQVEAVLSGSKVISSKSGGLFDTFYPANSFFLPNGIPIVLFKHRLIRFLKASHRPVEEEYRREFDSHISADKLEAFLSRR